MLSKQIIITLWLMAAAISLFEAYMQFTKGGFARPQLYLFLAVFGVSVYMYITRVRQRLKNNQPPKK